MHEELRKKKFAEEAAKLGMDEKTYIRIKNRELGLPSQEGRNLKVTLEDLEKMNYKDIWEHRDDDFKPSDVIVYKKKVIEDYEQDDNTDTDDVSRYIFGD
jgi:hypothetical protein